MRNSVSIFLLIAFGLHLALLGAYGHLNPERMVVRGIDPVGYYAYFPSLYVDGDFDFRNEFATLGEGRVPYFETETGLISNVFSIGPAMALSPLLLVADAYVRLSGGTADGLSAPYHIAAFLGLTFYACLALLMLGYWAGLHFGPRSGLWAALLAWGGTTLLYYSAPLALMPHAIGTAGAMLFLIACDRDGATRSRGALLIGFTLGLAMLARWQNGLFLLYPFAQSVMRFRVATERKTAVIQELKFWGALTLASLITFSPQFVAWAVMYGNPILVPMGEGFLRYLNPEILQVLFSMERGLITWTPMTLFAVGGLTAVRRPLASRAVALGAIFAAQLYVNSTVMDWDASWGFGMRRFTEMAPVFAFGIGALLTRWSAAEWRKAVIATGMLFIVWNELFIFQYVNHLVSWDAPLTWHEYAGDKFHLAKSLQRRLWHNEARLELSNGEFEEALASIEQARLYDDRHDDVFLLEAVILESMGEFERAEEALLHAQAIQPKNPHIDFLLNRVRSRLAPDPGDRTSKTPSNAPGVPSPQP